jgi:hypothetical protein
MARAAQTVTVKVKEIVTELSHKQAVREPVKKMETSVTVYEDGKVVVKTYEVTVDDQAISISKQ